MSHNVLAPALHHPVHTALPVLAYITDLQIAAVLVGVAFAAAWILAVRVSRQAGSASDDGTEPGRSS